MANSPRHLSGIPLPEAGSSISKLTNDILWSIFALNADMDQETESTSPALWTLLHCSQACCRWRQIIHSTSSLWARVINLNLLVKGKWREEVMHHTGDTLLSVRASDAGFYDLNATLAAVSFLDHYWSRIRHLNFEFWIPFKWMLVEDLVWELLQRPTTHLEAFTFKIPEGRGLKGPKSGYRFFNDRAPVLRKFVAPTAIDLGTHWLSHIRELHPFGPLPVDRLLEALSSMQCLEIFNGERVQLIPAAGGDKIRLPHIGIPSLQSLQLSVRSDLQPYVDFITNISIPHPISCHLKLVLYTSRWLASTRPNEAQWQRAADILCSLPRLCNIADATTVTLKVARNYLSFKASSEIFGSSDVHVSEDNGQSYDLDTVSQTHLQNLTIAFMRSASFRDIHRLTLLHLSVPRAADLIGYTQVFKCLSSARMLTTNTTILRFLTNHPQPTGSDTFFPQIHSLEVESCKDDEILAIKSFLKMRSNIGRPIMMLRVVCVEEIRQGVMSLFDEFKGLETAFEHRLETSRQSLNSTFS